jgi:hypothetical protein
MPPGPTAQQHDPSRGQGAGGWYRCLGVAEGLGSVIFEQVPPGWHRLTHWWEDRSGGATTGPAVPTPHRAHAPPCAARAGTQEPLGLGSVPFLLLEPGAPTSQCACQPRVWEGERGLAGGLRWCVAGEAAARPGVRVLAPENGSALTVTQVQCVHTS